MIYTTLADAKRYESVHPNFARAFAALAEYTKAPLEPGKYELDGKALFSSHQSYTTTPRHTDYEAHRRYIDIQYILEGEEAMDVAPLSASTETVPYHAEKDISFHASENGTTLHLTAGTLAILFPEDVHRPGVAVQAPVPVRKIVFKVEV